MKQGNIMVIGALVMGLLFGTGRAALAHTPLCACYDNGDGSVTCEAGFSDGSSAAGARMRVVAEDGVLLLEGKMDEFSEFTFDKPSGAYIVVFDAGKGHVIEINGKEIME
jgi:hypothetical protein